LEHVKFGRSGLMVSRLCLGTMTFGLQRDETGSRAILDAAAEGGVDFLDTADAYPLGGELSDRGRTEEIIGAWLQGRRGDFIVATKCVVPMGPHPWNRGMSRKHVLDAVDASLKRLRTDYVDLYQLHFYDDVTPMDEALEALDTVVRTGKARYVGVSNWPAYKVARAIGRTEVKGLAGIASVQPRYNLLFRSFERDLLPLCREEGIAVISYNPLAGGMLTGKHRMEGGPPEGTRFTLGAAGSMYTERYWHARQFEAVEAIRKVADAAGMSLATLAVAWVMANPAITCPIIGASRPEQLKDSLAAADKPLPADVKARLDEITAEWRLVET
jgi:aryl-alcohol dehydrogenase (NADP+)